MPEKRSDTEMGVDFAALARPATPNTYLVAPPDRCSARPDEAAPVFALPAARLYEIARAALAREPRAELVHEDGRALRLVLVQRSRLFRFPDTVTVQVFPLAGGGATLGVYSAAKYGRSDLGVNKRRVRRWLGLLARATAGERG
jgi:uncharacterized protein (DUF1499 family)